MRRAVVVGVIAFWAAVATLLIAAALTSGVDLGRVTIRQLAAHDTPSDCWIAIRDNVYDVTRYVATHPTKPAVVLRWCGKDATAAFEDKGTGRPHSPTAHAALEPLLVGRLPCGPPPR